MAMLSKFRIHAASMALRHNYYPCHNVISNTRAQCVSSSLSLSRHSYRNIVRIPPQLTATTTLGHDNRHGGSCSPLFYQSSNHLSTASREESQQERFRGTARLTRTAVRRMRLSQLQGELTSRGIDAEGKRDELVQRLLAALKDSSSKAKKQSQKANAVSHNQPIPSMQNLDHENQINHMMDVDLEMNYPLIHQFHNEDELGAITATDNTPPVDPECTYIIRVNSAHSGHTRIVKGSGVGMTLLKVEENNNTNDNEGSNHLSVIKTNQVLLPGPRTPFEADYCALIMAMRHAKNLGIKHLIMEIDALGIVHQVTGQGSLGTNGYQQQLHAKVLELKKAFESFQICHSSSPGSGKDQPLTKILARSALAKQRDLESDWNNMVDPMTDLPAALSEESSPHHGIDPTKQYLLQFDGGARGNPAGVAGAGMVIFEDDKEIWCGWSYLGSGSGKTNNVAEYESLIAGLECAEKLGIRKIRAEGDSELVVRQVTGQYQVKKDWLKPLCARVQQLTRNFDSFSIKSIPRAANQRADFLANHAMDTRTCNSKDDIS